MPDTNLERLGKQAKMTRDNRHMTQQQVSDASGLAVRTISKIERGLMNPSFEVLSALVGVLGMSIDSLLTSCGEIDDTEMQEFIGLYRTCPEKGRRFLMTAIRALVRELIDDTSMNSEESG